MHAYRRYEGAYWEDPITLLYRFSYGPTLPGP